MFGGYQSSNQSNIVNNNINSSVSNSTAIQSMLNVDQDASVNATNVFEGDQLRLRNKCSIGQNIDVDQEVEQDITAISKSDISYDTNLSTNITNDLKNDLTQKTPGFAGGFLSAQINNQLNKVSNSVNNNIRNNIFINRNQFISSLAKQNDKNIIKYNEVDCEDSEIYQNQNIQQKLSQEAVVSSDDTVSMTNVIAVTLTNTLSNTASQGPSLFGTIVGVLFMFVMLAKAYYTTENSKSTLEKVFFIWFASYIFFAVIMWCIMLFASDTLPFVGVVTKFEEPWFGSYCSDADFKDHAPDIDECLKQATNRKHWEHNWKEDSIRKHMNMSDISGTPISSSFTKDKQGIVCEKGSDGEKCRENAEDDYIAEMRLRTSVECSNIYDSNTNEFATTLEDNDFHYHHDFYSNIGPGGKWTVDESVKVKPVKIRNNQVQNDESIEILQPGTGYFTGGPYITKCVNKNGGACCKPGQTCRDGDDSNLTVYVNSLSSCSTNLAYLSEGIMSSQTNADDKYGLGCYKSIMPSESLSLPWQGALFLDGEDNPEQCPTSTMSSIAATVGYCMDTGGQTCMSADKCSVNYLKALNDNDHSARQGDHLREQEPLTICPPKNVGEEGGCILEINGVNKIVIENASEPGVKEKHMFHPDNIYTIDSNPPAGYKKPLYRNTDKGFNVLWSNDIKKPPTDSGGTGITAENSIWATSSLIKTKNEEGHNSDWTIDKFIDGKQKKDSICQEMNAGSVIINGHRIWSFDDNRGMGNICESKFKLNPILVKQYDKETNEKTFRTSPVGDSISPGGYIELGCEEKLISESSSGEKCYCKSGANITKTLNSNGWLYGIGLIPFGLSFIIAVFATLFIRRFNKVGKDVTGGNLDANEISTNVRNMGISFED